MENTERVPIPNSSPESLDSLQFGLTELFALVTLAAIMAASAAPVVHAMTIPSRGELMLAIGTQFLVIIGTVAWATYRRRSLLVQSGQRLGFANSHRDWCRRGPPILDAACLVFMSAAQLWLALKIAVEPYGFEVASPLAAAYLLLGYTFGWRLCRHLWRSHSNSMEFFVHGIVTGGIKFHPWKRVRLQPDGHNSQKVVVVLRYFHTSRWAHESIYLWTRRRKVHVDERLREKIFAATVAEHESATANV